MKKILENDFMDILNSNVSFEEFKDCTFFITGATGLIGSNMIKALLYVSEKKGLNIKILALVRNLAKANVLFADYLNNSALQFVVGDLICDQIQIPEKCDYILHAAAVTASNEMITKPVETIKTAVEGTDSILKLGVEKQVKAMVYLSSMEVYGNCAPGKKMDEASLGTIDLSNVRSCYPEGKRLCECLCLSYASEYGLNVSVARLAQTFGAGTLENENRVFAQFARSVINNENIVLHTMGESEGNYVYLSDAIVALLLLLTKGEKGEAYNISNEKNHCTIKQMADLVAHDVAHDKISVTIDIPKENKGYAPSVKLWFDAGKIQKLGWTPHVDLAEAYNRLIEWMK